MEEGVSVAPKSSSPGYVVELIGLMYRIECVCDKNKVK